MLYIDAVCEGLPILQICARRPKPAADRELPFRDYLKDKLIILGVFD